MHCMGCNDEAIELHDVRKMTEMKNETKLAKLLKRRCLSATAVARTAGVSPSTVTRLMAGQMPTEKTVKKLADALGVKERSILG